MRLLAIALALAGVLLGFGLPFAGHGGALLYLAPLCFVVAGVLAARSVQRRGGLLVLAGVVAAVFALVLPAVVNAVRNRQGIAWSVPSPENLMLAEAGMAVTAMDESTVLTGRDIATGDRRWRLSLGKPLDPSGQLNLQRVGQTLLVTARDGVLRGVDLKTGKERWKTPGSRTVIAAIADPEVVAVTRCSDGKNCTVQARSIQDGKLRWEAPVFIGGAFLGAPGGGEQLQERAKLWPASAVIVRQPPNGRRYEVRALATGRVVARASTTRDLLGVTGNRFLRATEDGTVTAADVDSGAVVWTKPANGLFAVRAESVQSDWLGVPDGGLVLTQRLASLPVISARGTYRLLDPRTGKVSEHPIDLPPSAVEVFATGGPDVTAESSTAGVAPRVPVLQAVRPDDSPLQVDGRRIDAGDVDFRSVDVTETQVAWEAPMEPFGGGEQQGIEVIDRRSGKRLVRYIADEVRVRSVGERLVIGDGDGEDGEDHEHVVEVP
jgi:outer membrane protein assembly factor BamB